MVSWQPCYWSRLSSEHPMGHWAHSAWAWHMEMCMIVAALAFEPSYGRAKNANNAGILHGVKTIDSHTHKHTYILIYRYNRPGIVCSCRPGPSEEWKCVPNLGWYTSNVYFSLWCYYLMILYFMVNRQMCLFTTCLSILTHKYACGLR